MPKYQVGKLWFFEELGRKPAAGETIELDEEAANRYMHNEPGLLKLARETAQAAPDTVRADKPKGRVTRERK